MLIGSGALAAKTRTPVALPPGTVQALLHSDRVGAATRRVLGARLLAKPASAPGFFSPEEAGVLSAVCASLASPGAGADLVVAVDARLTIDRGGWRADAAPTPGEAYRRALRGIDAAATAAFGRPFAKLDPPDRETVLRTLADATEEGMPRPVDALVELLSEAARVYAEPAAYERIGYLGFADAAGWYALGPDEAELPEPQALA